jgi:hypothetical protein
MVKRYGVERGFVTITYVTTIGGKSLKKTAGPERRLVSLYVVVKCVDKVVAGGAMWYRMYVWWEIVVY